MNDAAHAHLLLWTPRSGSAKRPPLFGAREALLPSLRQECR